MKIAFKPLFTITFATTPQIIGDVPMGYYRRTGMITEGSFEGEISGKALPGGGDWLFRRPDGVIHLDVRAILETDRGEMIYMTYTGRLKTNPEADAKLARDLQDSHAINDTRSAGDTHNQTPHRSGRGHESR